MAGILDRLSTDFRAVFTGREPERPDPRADLRMVPFNDTTRADAETVHRVRWELDRLARKHEREARLQRLRDATPLPALPGRPGEEL